MIHSMTGYASVTHALTDAQATSQVAASLSVELRTVNARYLEINFRLPEGMRVCEIELREMLTAQLARGKVDVCVHLQRSESVRLAPALNNEALQQLALLEQQILGRFQQADRLRVSEILNWPGVLIESTLPIDKLRLAVLACGRQALDELIHTRAREGAQLAKLLLKHVAEMQRMVAGILPVVPTLIAKQQQKITERLQVALAQATLTSATPRLLKEEAAERIRQEVMLYGARIDIAEEISRLSVHLGETQYLIKQGLIEQGRPVGKQLDIMMQELNREANTLGAKAAANAVKELADAAMQLKLLIEQMREQVQNIE